MKNKYDDEPKALMDFPYDSKIVLPLSVAHQIQSLLQHAIKTTTTWVSNGNSFNTLSKFEVPPVAYFDSVLEPVYDATMLTKLEVRAWADEMEKALKENDVENSSGDMLPPENWKKLKVPT